MDNEQQVVSLELSRRLQELGVITDSLFSYVNIDGEGEYYLYFHEQFPEECEYEGDPIPAYTSSELGKILPDYFSIFRENGKYKMGWEASWNSDLLGKFKSDCDTQCDSMAKMLIYLIENKFMEAPK